MVRGGEQPVLLSGERLKKTDVEALFTWVRIEVGSELQHDVMVYLSLYVN